MSDNSINQNTNNKIEDSSLSSNLVENDSLNLTYTPYIIFSVFIAAIASFNAGFNIGVMNIPEKIIKCSQTNILNSDLKFPNCYKVEDFVYGFVVGIFALGGFFGALSAGKILEKFGRKFGLYSLNIYFIIGSILLATSVHVSLLMLGRFFIGAGAGMSSAAVSSYIGEISTIKVRGALGSVLQLMLVIGILTSNLLGLLVKDSLGWRLILGFPAIPSILQIFLLSFCYETPRYLISKNKFNDAKISLQSFRGDCDIEKEFEQIVAGQKELDLLDSDSKSLNEVEDNNPKSTSLSIIQIFKDSFYRRLVIIILITHLSSQLTGINSIMLYSTEFLNKMFGDNSKYVTVGISVLNLIITIISLNLIDRLGRKKLLIISHSGMTLSSLLLVVGFVKNINGLVLGAVLLFVTAFALGLGPIPWLLVSEIFPTKVLSSATALSTSINWLSVFTIGQVFPSLNRLLKNYTFLPFAIASILSLIFTIIFLPETKGKSVEEITKLFEKETKQT